MYRYKYYYTMHIIRMAVTVKIDEVTNKKQK